MPIMILLMAEDHTARKNEWENAALDGFVYVFPAGLRAKKNDPTILEIVFVQVG